MYERKVSTGSLCIPSTFSGLSLRLGKEDHWCIKLSINLSLVIHIMLYMHHHIFYNKRWKQAHTKSGLLILLMTYPPPRLQSTDSTIQMTHGQRNPLNLQHKFWKSFQVFFFIRVGDRGDVHRICHNCVSVLYLLWMKPCQASNYRAGQTVK